MNYIGGSAIALLSTKVVSGPLKFRGDDAWLACHFYMTSRDTAPKEPASEEREQIGLAKFNVAIPQERHCTVMPKRHHVGLSGHAPIMGSIVKHATSSRSHVLQNI